MAARFILAALAACSGCNELRQGYVLLGLETFKFQPCSDAEQW